MDKIEAPAVTICSRNSSSSLGWKGEIPEDITTIKWLTPYCGQNQSFENISKCIQENTYKIDEIIKVVPPPDKPSKWNISDWKAQMLITRVGFCYSFNSTLLLGAHRPDSFVLQFPNNDISSLVFLHDHTPAKRLN